MERLTTRLPDGGFELREDLDLILNPTDEYTARTLRDALGKIENDIEDGYYLKLPVPLGQKVYEKDGSEWVMQPLYTAVGIGRDAGRLSTFADEAIGVTVFLSKEHDGKAENE